MATREKDADRQTLPLLVIAGLDPAIQAESGGGGDARIRSGHDDAEKTCLHPSLILTPMGPTLARVLARRAMTQEGRSVRTGLF